MNLEFEKIISIIKIFEVNIGKIVLYRVTPCLEENNVLVIGVQIEAYSVEDEGTLQFNVYVYNVQDGIEIYYATGESKLEE